MIQWYIGCSGFYYKSWKGIFYPENLPQQQWLDYYCQHFKTLEANVTFYRFPELSFLKNWYDKSPSNFHFAVKAPRLITHYKKFIGTAGLINDFYTVLHESLSDKLRCVLFQLPPSIGFSEKLLMQIVNDLDDSFNNVIEFRNASWWRQDVYDILAEHGISFCGMSHPDLPTNVVANTPLLYYRMHGSSKLYGSSYSDAELKILLNSIQSNDQVQGAYIYFNNDMEGHAIENATSLKQLTHDITGSSVKK